MVQTMVAGGLGMLLYMILIFYSSITAQEVASEKGTKIMEVVFSSIKATDYFFARMLGLFGVIFTHIFVYVIGLVAVWIFRARYPCCQGFSRSKLSNYPAPSRSDLAQYRLLHYPWGLYVCGALCLLRLHSSTT